MAEAEAAASAAAAAIAAQQANTDLTPIQEQLEENAEFVNVKARMVSRDSDSPE